MKILTKGFTEDCVRLWECVAGVFHRTPKPTATHRYADIDMVTFLVACEHGWNGAIQSMLAHKGIPELNSNFRIALTEEEEKEWHLPLELAVRARSPRCALMLLKCGADPKAKCRVCGKRPFQYANTIMRSVLKCRQDKLKFYECTDAEFAHYEALRTSEDKFFWDRVNKFFNHPAVFHSVIHRQDNLKRMVYPIIMGDCNDDEIQWMLDKIAPPGGGYL